MRRELARAGAEWWAQRVYGRPKPVTTGSGGMGDLGLEGLRALVEADRPEPDPARVARFTNALAALILDRVEREGGYLMRVDWDPAPELADLTADDPAAHWPEKTGMQATDAGIEVSDGYGRGWTLLEVP